MSEGNALRTLWGPAGALIFGSVVLGIVTVWVGTQENPSKLAVSLLQAITLVFGTVGSYILGQDASREAAVVSRAAAKESLRLPARSAFRRVLHLYLALGRQRAATRDQVANLSRLVESDGKTIQLEHALASLVALDYIVVEQIGTGADALEDWRDLVPEEVEAIEAKAREGEETNG